MWNLMLKTLHYFLCLPAHDLEYLGPVSSNCLNAQIPLKASIVQTSGGLNTWVKPNLMWDLELKTLDYFSSVASYDLRVFGSS